MWKGVVADGVVFENVIYLTYLSLNIGEQVRVKLVHRADNLLQNTATFPAGIIYVLFVTIANKSLRTMAID